MIGLLVAIAAIELSFVGAALYALVLCAAWLFMNTLVWSLSAESIVYNLIGLTPNLLLCIGLGRVLRTLEFQKDHLEEQKRQTDILLDQAQQKRLAIEEGHQKERRLAVLKQRLEGTKQIHHDLNGAMKALKEEILNAKKICETEPQEGLTSIQSCHCLTKTTLNRVRESVARLRHHPRPSQIADRKTLR